MHLQIALFVLQREIGAEVVVPHVRELIGLGVGLIGDSFGDLLCLVRQGEGKRAGKQDHKAGGKQLFQGEYSFRRIRKKDPATG